MSQHPVQRGPATEGHAELWSQLSLEHFLQPPEPPPEPQCLIGALGSATEAVLLQGTSPLLQYQPCAPLSPAPATNPERGGGEPGISKKK